MKAFIFINLIHYAIIWKCNCLHFDKALPKYLLHHPK